MTHLLALVLLFVQAQASPAPAEGPAGRILFTRQLEGRDDLFVLHLADGRIYHPCWSPDGTRLAYASGSQGNGDILSCAPDGSEPRNLTRHPARDNFPAWSPRGDSIAFASDRAGSWSLYRMRPDGSDVRRLPSEGQALEPAWFPDGRRLAFQASDEEADAFDLWTLELTDGGTLGPATRLTRGPASDERPAVSPDGEWIVFESDRAGGIQLFLLPSRGGEPRQLTSEGYCYGASWFPPAER